jgi:hypothetical protein
MEKSRELRNRSAWFRDYAERTRNPMIWELRLRRAEELEKEADEIESRSGKQR